jgi:hypothetical protein
MSINEEKLTENFPDWIKPLIKTIHVAAFERRVALIDRLDAKVQTGILHKFFVPHVRFSIILIVTFASGKL